MWETRVPESMAQLPGRAHELDDKPPMPVAATTPLQWAVAAINNAAGRRFVVVSTPRGVLRFLAGSKKFEEWTGRASECVIGTYQDPDPNQLADDIRSEFYGRLKKSVGRKTLYAGKETQYARDYYQKNKVRIAAYRRDLRARKKAEAQCGPSA